MTEKEGFLLTGAFLVITPPLALRPSHHGVLEDLAMKTLCSRAWQEVLAINCALPSLSSSAQVGDLE